MREIIVRGISGILYIAMILIALYASREWFFVLFSFLGTLTIYEFMKLEKINQPLYYLLLLFALFFLSYLIIDKNALYLYAIIAIFINLFLIKDLLTTSSIPLFRVKKHILIIGYLISGFVFLTQIPYYQFTYTPQVIVSIFMLIWANDSFAYLVGKNFGKTKLLEKVSPKKTIEGFIGGIIASLILSLILYNHFGLFKSWVWIALALIISVFGTFGDLVQSKLKRQAGVKDSGRIMPGHGGIYDRLDSIIFVSPFVYSMLEIINHVS